MRSIGNKCKERATINCYCIIALKKTWLIGVHGKSPTGNRRVAQALEDDCVKLTALLHSANL